MPLFVNYFLVSNSNMATASSLVQKLDREFLECGICLDQFKQPRSLPCLHAFCHECLNIWCQKQSEIRCPNCNRPTVIPKDGVAGFPVQFMVNNLQETVGLEKLKVGVQAELCLCLFCVLYICLFVWRKETQMFSLCILTVRVSF